MEILVFKSDNITLEIELYQNNDFISDINQALQKNPNTKTFMFNDMGEDWIQIIDVEDKENIITLIPETL